MLPEGEDVNSLLQSHQPDIIGHLLNERIFLFSTEENGRKQKAESRTEEGQCHEGVLRSSVLRSALPRSASHLLDSSNPDNIRFSGLGALYTAKGVLKNPADSLKIALQVLHPVSGNDYRAKVDMYEYKQLQQISKIAAELLQLPAELLEQDLRQFTQQLETFKEQYRESKATKRRVEMPEATVKSCLSFLQNPQLLKRLNEKIGQSGIVGEESNRLFLFIIATGYKMPETLHALIQGSSGSGKTQLLKTISHLMPPEDTKHFTRVTDNSFYNYGEYDLENKLLCFEDIDGLKEEALLALRELQSNNILISSTSQKDDNGNIRSMERIVRGPIASLSATTRGDYYEDNISRSFVIAVDESREQTQRIIAYQNDKAAGLIERKQEEQVRHFIQNCVRLLKPLEVINPYANKVTLPPQAHKIRRLNEMYQNIVKQIVILHQHQRQRDSQGRLIAERDDLENACNLLFESIILKVDELDGNLRQFFEKLKNYVSEKGQDYEFNRFEVMSITGLRKTQQHLYINKLLELEYIQQYGYANRGYRYRIVHHDNIGILRNQVKEHLQYQLQNIDNQ
jgi:energy-coupling factor transporter ATP-binding protein EcfA2